MKNTKETREPLYALNKSAAQYWHEIAKGYHQSSDKYYQ
jgi:hypothetical protein